MRYYTKEWYELSREVNYTCGITPIPSKEYTDQEIRDFYDRELRKTISEEKEFYDEPPTFLISASELDEESFCPEDWIEVNEDMGTCKENPSFEEVKSMLMLQEEKAMQEYENRPPFDVTEVVKEFEEFYRCSLQNCMERFPKWVTNKVDARILALDLMPKDIYRQLKQEEKKNKKILEKMERTAEKELKKHWSQIPQKIAEIFQYHDSYILSLEKKEQDVVMLLNNGELHKEEEKAIYDKIVFRDVDLFEYEEKMQISCSRQEEEYISNCYYLYEELYRTEQEEFEYHLMVMNEEVRYITIRCKGIASEKEHLEYGALEIDIES